MDSDSLKLLTFLYLLEDKVLMGSVLQAPKLLYNILIFVQ